MSDPVTPTGDPEHDAWLREALRHAPDASVAPPLSLREAILAEARAATKAAPRKAPAPSLADRFAELWSWLGRPPVAAGFASVMAATLVGLMWWDRPLDEMAPPPPEPVAAAPAPAPEAARPTPAPAAAPPVVDQATATTQATPPAAPAEALRPPPGTRPATAERAATGDRAERERRGFAAAPQAQPPAAAVATPEKAKTAADALGEGRKDTDSRTANAAPARPAAPATAIAPPATAAPAATAPPAMPSVATPPSPFPARDARENDAQTPAPTQSPSPPRSEPVALAKKAGKAEKNDAEEKRQAEVAQSRLPAAAPATTGAAPTGVLQPSPGASSTGGVAAGRFAATPQPAPLARQRAAESATTTARPMAPLLAALSNDGARWSRPISAGETVAADAATQAWLGRVDAAASQWQPVADRLSRLDGASAASAEAGTLLLYREGRVAAIVRIEDAGAYFETRPGPAWFAPLAPDVVARLRATLPAVTR
jgi:hypothetical protein